MSKRFVWIIIAVLAVVGAYAAAYRSAQPTGTPQGQIRGAIMDSVEALNHGNVSGAMSVVSPDYKDSSYNRSQLYMMARQAAENRAYWSAVVQQVQPEIT